MPSSRPKTDYVRGVRDGSPFVFVVAPFAALFGLVATEAGLSLVETVGFSVVVIAGAAQFAALQLMVDDAPTLVVILTALAVNLRMAMYSASLASYIGHAPLWQRAVVAYLIVDQSYALSVARYQAEPRMALSNRVAYFLGVVSPVTPVWYMFTLIGAVAGQRIPESLALDFAVPIAFLAIVAPMLRTLAHVLAAATSVTLALSLGFLPYNAGLLLAGLLAMIVGAQVEGYTKRRAP